MIVFPLHFILMTFQAVRELLGIRTCKIQKNKSKDKGKSKEVKIDVFK